MKDKLKKLFMIRNFTDVYTKIIVLFYIIFSLYLIIINFQEINVIQKRAFILAGIIILLIFILFRKFSHKIKINKPIIVILLIFPILLRFGLLFLKYYNFTDDYSFLLNSSINYSLGKDIDFNYISLFPYIFSYISLLGKFMKIFGSKYLSVVLLNIIADLITTILIYNISLKYKNKSYAIKFTLFYLYNPFNIFWLTKCCPVIVVNMFLTLVLFLFLKINFSDKKFIVYSFLTGIVSAITNSFRPILIIFIIALIVYFLYLVLKKENIKKIITCLSIIILSFTISNKLLLYSIGNNIGISLKKVQSGFTILTGSNFDSSGTWNMQDATLFSELVAKYGRSEGPKRATKIALDRYKSNGFKKNKQLLYNKSRVFATDIDTYTYLDIMNSIKTHIPNRLCIFLEYYLSFWFYIVIFLNFIVSILLFKNDNYKFDFVIPIFALGLFLSSLLVEVSARYFMPLMLLLIFVSSYIFCKDQDLLKNERIIG